MPPFSPVAKGLAEFDELARAYKALQASVVTRGIIRPCRMGCGTAARAIQYRKSRLQSALPQYTAPGTRRLLERNCLCGVRKVPCNRPSMEER